jgi:serine/threonine-protein kinase RsbW
MKPFNIKIPSLTENVRVVESYIENAKETYGISENIFANVLVAVTELVNNAIVHGNKNDKDKVVELSLELIEETKLRFVVKDQGKGFDPELLPDPTAPENLYNPGGRGIYIIKNLADEIYFHEKGTKIELIFHLNSEN